MLLRAVRSDCPLGSSWGTPKRGAAVHLMSATSLPGRRIPALLSSVRRPEATIRTADPLGESRETSQLDISHVAKALSQHCFDVADVKSDLGLSSHGNKCAEDFQSRAGFRRRCLKAIRE